MFSPRAFPVRRKEHSVSLQASLGASSLRQTSRRAALGAPRGLSRVDLLPSPLGLVTVALLPLIFLHFSFVCVYC